MTVIQDAIDGYRKSPSHQRLVDDMYDLLFEYKGLHAQLAALGKYAETRPLTAEENGQVTEFESQMQKLVQKYNDLLPSR